MAKVQRKKTEMISIEVLEESDIMLRKIDETEVERVSRQARICPERITPIIVAKRGSKRIIIKGIETVRGCTYAGMGMVPAYFVECKTDAEVVREQIRVNTEPSGIDAWEAYRVAKLDRRIVKAMQKGFRENNLNDLAKMLNRALDNEAFEKIDGMLESMRSEGLRLTLPWYYVTLISKKDRQGAAADEVIKTTLDLWKNDRVFSWASYGTVRTLCNHAGHGVSKHETTGTGLEEERQPYKKLQKQLKWIKWFLNLENNELFVHGYKSRKEAMRALRKSKADDAIFVILTTKSLDEVSTPQ